MDLARSSTPRKTPLLHKLIQACKAGRPENHVRERLNPNKGEYSCIQQCMQTVTISKGPLIGTCVGAGLLVESGMHSETTRVI